MKPYTHKVYSCFHISPNVSLIGLLGLYSPVSSGGCLSGQRMGVFCPVPAGVGQQKTREEKRAEENRSRDRRGDLCPRRCSYDRAAGLAFPL